MPAITSNGCSHSRRKVIAKARPRRISPPCGIGRTAHCRRRAASRCAGRGNRSRRPRHDTCGSAGRSRILTLRRRFARPHDRGRVRVNPTTPKCSTPSASRSCVGATMGGSRTASPGERPCPRQRTIRLCLCRRAQFDRRAWRGASPARTDTSAISGEPRCAFCPGLDHARRVRPGGGAVPTRASSPLSIPAS